jgi:DNA-binding MarR family transcriptional regulator
MNKMAPPATRTGLLSTLGEANRYVALAREIALKDCGLSAAKMGALRELVQAGQPKSLGELAECLSCGKSNITQLIDRLEEDGLVQRVSDSNDRRCMRATVTHEGRRRYTLGLKAEREIEGQMLENLSAHEQEQLGMLLAKFIPPNE